MSDLGLVVAMGAGVFLLRLAGLSLPAVTVPPALERALRFVPVSLLTALVVISLTGGQRTGWEGERRPSPSGPPSSCGRGRCGPASPAASPSTGFFASSEHQSRKGNAAQLRRLLISPEARGMGLGRCLVETALAFCRETGCDSIYLWTVQGLPAAAHLYASTGFVKTDELPPSDWGVTVIKSGTSCGCRGTSQGTPHRAARRRILSAPARGARW